MVGRVKIYSMVAHVAALIATFSAACTAGAATTQREQSTSIPNSVSLSELRTLLMAAKLDIPTNNIPENGIASHQFSAPTSPKLVHENRLRFSDRDLGDGRILIWPDGVTLAEQAKWVQMFDDETLKAWGGASGYFPFRELNVVYVPAAKNRRIRPHVSAKHLGQSILKQVTIEEDPFGEKGSVSITYVRDGDDRQLDCNPAVGRLYPVPGNTGDRWCTAWIVGQTGKIITAGHCIDRTEGAAPQLVEFNLSGEDAVCKKERSIIHQYAIDRQRCVFDMDKEYRVNDWAVCQAVANSNTGKLPHEGQDSFLVAAQMVPGDKDEVSLIGYGVIDLKKVLNDVQSIGEGTFEGMGSSRNMPYLQYSADTADGSSGSPVIYQGKAVGVHTRGNPCHAGYNEGTPFLNTEFYKAATD